MIFPNLIQARKMTNMDKKAFQKPKEITNQTNEQGVLNVKN
jgi:hypothetical protein